MRRRVLDTLQIGLHVGNQCPPTFGLSDHRRDLVQHGKNLGHAALVEHRDLYPVSNQGRCNIRLQVGKAKHTVWFQRQYLVDLSREKGTDPGLLSPCAPGPHGVAGDTHDAAFLSKQVQPLGGFLSQADDALRAEIGTGTGIVTHGQFQNL